MTCFGLEKLSCSLGTVFLHASASSPTKHQVLVFNLESFGLWLIGQNGSGGEEISGGRCCSCHSIWRQSKRRHLNTPCKDTPSVPKRLLLSPLSEILPSFNSTVRLWETFYIQNAGVSNSFGILQLNILER